MASLMAELNKLFNDFDIALNNNQFRVAVASLREARPLATSRAASRKAPELFAQCARRCVEAALTASHNELNARNFANAFEYADAVREFCGQDILGYDRAFWEKIQLWIPLVQTDYSFNELFPRIETALDRLFEPVVDRAETVKLLQSYFARASTLGRLTREAQQALERYELEWSRSTDVFDAVSRAAHNAEGGQLHRAEAALTGLLEAGLRPAARSLVQAALAKVTSRQQKARSRATKARAILQRGDIKRARRALGEAQAYWADLDWTALEHEFDEREFDECAAQIEATLGSVSSDGLPAFRDSLAADLERLDELRGSVEARHQRYAELVSRSQATDRAAAALARAKGAARSNKLGAALTELEGVSRGLKDGAAIRIEVDEEVSRFKAKGRRFSAERQLEAVYALCADGVPSKARELLESVRADLPDTMVADALRQIAAASRKGVEAVRAAWRRGDYRTALDLNTRLSADSKALTEEEVVDLQDRMRTASACVHQVRASLAKGRPTPQEQNAWALLVAEAGERHKLADGLDPLARLLDALDLATKAQHDLATLCRASPLAGDLAEAVTANVEDGLTQPDRGEEFQATRTQLKRAANQLAAAGTDLPWVDRLGAELDEQAHKAGRWAAASDVLWALLLVLGSDGQLKPERLRSALDALREECGDDLEHEDLIDLASAAAGAHVALRDARSERRNGSVCAALTRLDSLNVALIPLEAALLRSIDKERERLTAGTEEAEGAVSEARTALDGRNYAMVAKLLDAATKHASDFPGVAELGAELARLRSQAEKREADLAQYLEQRDFSGAERELDGLRYLRSNSALGRHRKKLERLAREVGAEAREQLRKGCIEKALKMLQGVPLGAAEWNEDEVRVAHERVERARRTLAESVEAVSSRLPRAAELETAKRLIGEAREANPGHPLLVRVEGILGLAERFRSAQDRAEPYKRPGLRDVTTRQELGEALERVEALSSELKTLVSDARLVEEDLEHDEGGQDLASRIGWLRGLDDVCASLGRQVDGKKHELSALRRLDDTLGAMPDVDQLRTLIERVASYTRENPTTQLLAHPLLRPLPARVAAALETNESVPLNERIRLCRDAMTLWNAQPLHDLEAVLGRSLETEQVSGPFHLQSPEGEGLSVLPASAGRAGLGVVDPKNQTPDHHHTPYVFLNFDFMNAPVSRAHLAIERRRGKIRVKNLSKLGTDCDGRPLPASGQSVALSVGQHLTLGGGLVGFEVESIQGEQAIVLRVLDADIEGFKTWSQERRMKSDVPAGLPTAGKRFLILFERYMLDEGRALEITGTNGVMLHVDGKRLPLVKGEVAGFAVEPTEQLFI